VDSRSTYRAQRSADRRRAQRSAEERRGAQRSAEERRPKKSAEERRPKKNAEERRPKKSAEERRGAQTEEVISDNYLSATVVSFQKKNCGSHFVPFSLHVILSVSSTTARKAATAFHFLSSLLSPLSFPVGPGTDRNASISASGLSFRLLSNLIE
jgi:hypothetical protein